MAMRSDTTDKVLTGTALVKLMIQCAITVSAGLLLVGCSLDLAGQRTAVMQRDGAGFVTPGTNLEMARLAFRRGNYGIAISHLERELALRPNSVSALNGLGATYDQIGRFEIAQQYYFRALEVAPDPATTLAILGYSKHLEGKTEVAARILQLSLSLDPHNEVASANLQQVTHMLAAQSPVAVLAAEPLTFALRIEVSNGSGVSGMGARVRSILQAQSTLLAAGSKVVRLTNADHFNYASTTVFYRRGLDAAVAELINSLPLQTLHFQETDQLAPGVDVQLLLGTDYIPYDVRS